MFELFDGGKIGLDWLVYPNDEIETEEKTFENSKKNEVKRPLLVFVPGMSGTSSQMYSLNLAHACIEQNIDMVVVNYRGLAGVPLSVSFLIRKSVTW